MMPEEAPDRALVVGSGSIAARHVRNLLALGAREVLLCTGRDVSSVAAFQDARVTVVDTMPDDPPRLAIVANDTDRHVTSALQLAERGVHLLIEKPVAARIDADLELLVAEVEKRGLVARVAYNLRFLPVFREVERILGEGGIGHLLFVRIEAGQHLAAWRPDRSYRLAYSASASRGGGVALDLSHEVDYMRMLFGRPNVSCVHHAHSGVLGIESPDIFDAIYEFPGGPVCTVHLDYLEAAVRRRIRIVGADGVVECDLAAHRLRVQSAHVTQMLVDQPLFNVEETYVDELVSFLSEASGGTPGDVCLPTIQDGREILELVGQAPTAEDSSRSAP